MWRHISGVKDPKSVKKDSTIVKKTDYDKNYDKNRTRSYQPHWEKEFPWLKNTDDGMVCQMCIQNKDVADPSVFLTGCKNYTLNPVRAHEKSSSHKKAESRVTNLNRNRHSSAPQTHAEKALCMLNTDIKCKVIKLIRNSHALAKHCKPMTDFPWLCNLDNIKGTDVGETYINDKYCKVFQTHIADVERQKLENSLKLSKFISIMVDGTTDSAVIEQEIMYVRSACDGIPVTSFVSVECVEKANAPGILTAIENSMYSIKDAQWKSKLVGLTTDGASVMVGKKAGVSALLKKELPHLITTHCTAHRLELAVKDVMFSVKWYDKINQLLLGLYLFYHHSALNRSNLKNSCKAAGVPYYTPKRVGGTRWVTHTKDAVQNTLQSYGGLVLHLQQMDFALKSAQAARAKGYHSLLTDEKCIRYLHLLADITSELSTVSLALQDNNTCIGEVYEVISDAKANLLRLKDRPGVFLKKIDSCTDFHGQDLTNTNKCEEFETERRKVIDSLIQHINSRFYELEASDSLMMAMNKLINFKMWPHDENDYRDFGEDELDDVTTHFNHVLENNGVDVHKCPQEFNVLKNHVNKRYKVHSDAKWPDIFTACRDKCENMLSVISLIQCLPASQAECERGFSQMKKVKNDWRSSLGYQSLNVQLRILLLSSDINEFDPEPVYAAWMRSSKKSRRPTLLPHGSRKKLKLDMLDIIIENECEKVCETEEKDSFDSSDDEEEDDDLLMLEDYFRN